MTQLNVDPAHLEELAAAQDQAAVDLEASAKATAGIPWKSWLSHGAISSFSNLAICAAEEARREAVGRIEEETKRLSESLRVAGATYRSSDEVLGADLDQHIIATDPT